MLSSYPDINSNSYIYKITWYGHQITRHVSNEDVYTRASLDIITSMRKEIKYMILGAKCGN